MIQFIQSHLKAQMFALSMMKDYQRVQRLHRLFAVCFYGPVANGLRVGLSGLLCPGCKMCLKAGALACICDSVNG